MAQANYLGRRKTSTARLYIKPGSGSFIVNNISIEDYLPVKAMRNIALLPIHITETEGHCFWRAPLPLLFIHATNDA